MNPSLLFASVRPPVIDLPHWITAMDAELISKVVHITKSKPGLWRLAAPYDDKDVFDPWREDDTPFSLWNLPANQAELLAPGRYAAEALFGTQAVLLDSAIDEKAVLQLSERRGERRETGGFYLEGMQDLPGLGKLLDLAGWSLIPIAPD